MEVATIVKDQIIDWTREWFKVNGNNCNAIIGISGGKDSSISAALLVEALGRDRVIGVKMPNGEQNDIEYSNEIIDYLGIKSYEVNIKNIVDSVYSSIAGNAVSYTDISEQTKTNLPARIRMTVLYAISQSMNGRVCNTCNCSEDYVGYATMYGDNCGDFALLRDLKVCEVKQIGYALGLPEKFIEKTPSDGLCGKTDEENLGFTYEDVDKFLYGIYKYGLAVDRIKQRHHDNLFKYNLYIDHYEPSYDMRDLMNPYRN